MRWHMRPAALVASVLAEINRDREKRDEPFEIEDFLPSTPEQEVQQELAESGQDLAALEAYKQRLGVAGLTPNK
jgi:hypothetical protein